MPGSWIRTSVAIMVAAAACAPLQTSEKAGVASGILPAKEVLHYSVEWRLITAGKARLSWNETSQPRGWLAGLHLESAGLVSKLYKVNDDYTAVLGSDLCAASSQMNAQEGKRHRESQVRYDRETKKAHYVETDLLRNAVVSTREVEIPGCVHDVVGGLYMLRTLNLEPGQSAQIPISDGKKSVLARVEAQQREEVKTPSGTYQTVRYEAFLFNNVLYRRNARLYVWLTEDRRKLPVQIRVRMQFTVGTITFQLDKEETT